jgi:two-component system phosphate regulon response regulator PhoB
MSRILVVEDESAIAELISINLRHAGYEVTLAGNAEQAQLEVDRVLPDLVVLDWMLPGQTGLALARQWRGATRTRELPIILLTARAEEVDKVSGLDAGADDYLTKPFSTNELLARIRAVLRLLHFFMTHPERVHSRSQLLDRVWGDHVFIEERTVDVHVKRLREALEKVSCARMIETVRGAGYRLTQQSSALSA